MADRYEDRRYISDDEVIQPAQPAAPNKGGDPLAELAKLIGQTDPFANFGRANPTHPLRRDPVTRAGQAHSDRDPDADEFFDREIFDEAPKPPPWVQHRAEALAAEHEQGDGQGEAVDDLASRPHPLRRFAGDAEPHADAQYADAPYQDGHYSSASSPPNGPYPNDPYAYQDDYGDQPDAARDKPRRGLITIAAVLGLAVIGTGGALAYRTFVSAPRSGEIPVIKADPNPVKVVPPTTAEAANKAIQDRIGSGNGEKLVPREEQPVDVRDPTKAAAVRPSTGNFTAKSPSTGTAPTPSGALPTQGEEPRRVRTFTVKGDQNDAASSPLAKQPSRAAAATTPPPAAPPPRPAPQSSSTPGPTASLAPSPAPQSSGPLSLNPRANSGPAATAPSGGGGYIVQVSSQRSEADARASYSALQSKFPSVLGSRSASIRRADLGDKGGVYYRAVLGPFAGAEEAAALCGNLKSAGGQCLVQRN